MTPLSSCLSTLTLAGALLASCAHTPPEQVQSRPEPEPEAADVPAEEEALSDVDTEAAENSEPSNTEPQVAETAKVRELRISLGDQLFTYEEDGRLVRAGPISSGAEGSPTPTGQFAILSKDKDKVSSRYTNQLGMQAWMPYAMQFHGHYFLHEGWLPGYPDSHGCVRVGEEDARFLFETMQIGDAVIVKE